MPPGALAGAAWWTCVIALTPRTFILVWAVGSSISLLSPGRFSQPRCAVTPRVFAVFAVSEMPLLSLQVPHPRSSRLPAGPGWGLHVLAGLSPGPAGRLQRALLAPQLAGEPQPGTEGHPAGRGASPGSGGGAGSLPPAPAGLRSLPCAPLCCKPGCVRASKGKTKPPVHQSCVKWQIHSCGGGNSLLMWHFAEGG